MLSSYYNLADKGIPLLLPVRDGHLLDDKESIAHNGTAQLPNRHLTIST
jgi:hypothetical protein